MTANGDLVERAMNAVEVANCKLANDLLDIEPESWQQDTPRLSGIIHVE